MDAPKLIAGSEIKAGQFVSMTAAGTVVPSLPLDFRPITVSPLVYVMGPAGRRRCRRRPKVTRVQSAPWSSAITVTYESRLSLYPRIRKPKGLRKHIRREKAARRTA